MVDTLLSLNLVQGTIGDAISRMEKLLPRKDPLVRVANAPRLHQDDLLYSGKRLTYTSPVEDGSQHCGVLYEQYLKWSVVAHVGDDIAGAGSVDSYG